MPEEKIRRSSNQTPTINPVELFEKDIQELSTPDQEKFYELIETYAEQFMIEGRQLTGI